MGAYAATKLTQAKFLGAVKKLALVQHAFQHPHHLQHAPRNIFAIGRVRPSALRSTYPCLSLSLSLSLYPSAASVPQPSGQLITVYLSIYLSLYLSIYLYIYIYVYNISDVRGGSGETGVGARGGNCATAPTRYVSVSTLNGYVCLYSTQLGLCLYSTLSHAASSATAPTTYKYI